MRAKRIDSNQNEITQTFRSMGCSVFITSMVGNGFGDIVVGIGGSPGGDTGENWIIEIKDGAKPLSRQKLTVDEINFHASWKGPIAIVRSVEDVVNLVNRVRGRMSRI
jgi:glycerate kinase